MSDWPHITRTVQETIEAIDQGHRQILVTAPTGAGKTRMMTRIIEHYNSLALYTHRKMLLEQTSEVLTKAGVAHGIMAAGHYPDDTQNIQLCSVQTIDRRVLKDELWELHPADVVLVDEAHNNKSGVMQQVLGRHLIQGSAVIGFTATPIGLGSVYKHLLVGATNSELRKCGAHVPCETYAPDEPDTQYLERVKSGDFSEKSVVKAIMTPTIFGRVKEWLCKINPELKPSILFGPDVAGSRWFAERLCAAGIMAAHIDGEKVWLNGIETTNTPEARRQIRELSESGFIRVVCNRFVLREGIDWPHLAHGIFATSFGALTSYLQSGGRLLRSHESLSSVTIQDHGGNFHRHGSLNADRIWELDCTEKVLRENRKERLRNKEEKEPLVCPACKKVVLAMGKCPKCGFTITRKSREVTQLDGSLKKVWGDIYRPRKQSTRSEDVNKWVSCYFRCKNSGRTFNQAAALFYRDMGIWPNKQWPYCPKSEADWYAKVAAVPRNNLIKEMDCVPA